jgi:hypothetical protein
MFSRSETIRTDRAFRVWRWMALATCALVAGVIVVAPDPDSRLRSALAVHDLGHVVAFGLVAALFAFLSSARSRPTLPARVAAFWLAAGAALALGAAVEAAQAVSGRNGDPWDVVRDGAGALCVAWLLVASDPAISARARTAAAGVAMVTVAAFAYPTAAALADEARARAQFPVLASFETAMELSRFEFTHGAKPRIVPARDDEDRPVSGVRLRLPPGKYPGLVLGHFPEDWSGLRALRLLILNPEPTPIEISVRIDDAAYDYRLDLADRYNRAFLLPPGANRIDILLSEVAAAPRGRRFDLGHVRSLLLYAVDLERPREIVIGPITLLH